MTEGPVRVEIRDKRRAETGVREVQVSNPPAPTLPRRPWWLVVRLLRRATINFADDRCTHMAAAISFFGLFALFPLTLLAISVFGIVLRDASVQARVLQAIVEALPVEETSVEDSLRALADLGPTLTAVALVGSIWSAGALSSAVRRSIDVVFDVDRPRPLLRRKLVDYSLLLVVGLLFIGSFTLTAAWRVAEARADEWFTVVGGRLAWPWELGAVAIPAAMSFLTFLFVYWLLPNRQLRLRYIWPGALLAALGIEAAQYGFALYLAGFAHYDVVYGSLGGVFALLFWVYLSSNILLFGAEVAAELPHVLRDEPRHGRAGTTEANWRASLLAVLRGVVLAPGEQAGPAVPEHSADTDAPERQA